VNKDILGTERNECRILVGKPVGKRPLQGLRLRRITLKWILKK
jgi:hypothetical protein